MGEDPFSLFFSLFFFVNSKADRKNEPREKGGKKREEKPKSASFPKKRYS